MSKLGTSGNLGDYCLAVESTVIKLGVALPASCFIILGRGGIP